MMARKILDLLGLLVDNVGSLFELAIDQLLVGLVDERGEEEDGGREEGKTPEWDDLDKVVREEGTQESLGFISGFASMCKVKCLTAAEANTFSANTIR